MVSPPPGEVINTVIRSKYHAIRRFNCLMASRHVIRAAKPMARNQHSRCQTECSGRFLPVVPEFADNGQSPADACRGQAGRSPSKKSVKYRIQAVTPLTPVHFAGGPVDEYAPEAEINRKWNGKVMLRLRYWWICKGEWIKKASGNRAAANSLFSRR